MFLILNPSTSLAKPDTGTSLMVYLISVTRSALYFGAVKVYFQSPLLSGLTETVSTIRLPSFRCTVMLSGKTSLCFIPAGRFVKSQVLTTGISIISVPIKVLVAVT